jgi:hypothetical protein
MVSKAYAPIVYHVTSGRKIHTARTTFINESRPTPGYLSGENEESKSYFNENWNRQAGEYSYLSPSLSSSV